jgi:hypothetical protein
MDKTQTIDRLLTPEESAEILRVKVSWLYQHTRRRSQDRIPFVKGEALCAQIISKLNPTRKSQIAA